MKLKHYFFLLAVGIVLLAGIALFATYHSHPTLFYVTESFVVLLLFYLCYFYRKTIRPYDTLIGGMELVRDLDLTTRLAPSGQHETDIIVRTFNPNRSLGPILFSNIKPLCCSPQSQECLSLVHSSHKT